MPYITNTDVATFLQLTLTAAQQAAVDALISGVETAAETYCNRTFDTTAQQTESFDGNTGVFFPKHSPITSIDGITVDGYLVDPSEIYLYGSYVKLGYLADSGHQNIEITYTPSESLPEDLKQALIQWVANLFKSSQEAGKDVKRVKIGDGEIEYTPSTREMPPFVEQVLDSYRLSPI